MSVPSDPYDSRTTKWLRSHPKGAAVVALALLVLLVGLVAVREWNQARGNMLDSQSEILTGLGLVSAALFVAWRANLRIRKH